MLIGEYVGLRAIERNDLPQLLEWRNRPEYRRYFREYRELSSEHQEKWFQAVVMGDPRTNMFAITELTTGQLIGACGLCYIDWVNRSADFSIYIGVDSLYIDEKYAPDAAKVMIKYAFEELGIHRLWAEIYDIDDPKIQFFNSLDFVLDGRFRHTHWTEGSWHDSLFYSLLEGEYIIKK